MKKNVIITLGSAVCLLVSCGNSDMPSITEDRAKELAHEISARQENPQVFTEPKNFMYTSETIYNQDNFTPSVGKIVTNQVEKIVNEVDVEKLAIRSYAFSTSVEGTCEWEYIRYYDNVDGKLRDLYNENGYKTRYDQPCDFDTAKETIIGLRNFHQPIYKWLDDGEGTTLFAFDYDYDDQGEKYYYYDLDMTYYQQLRKLYQNETDQFCKIYVGSSGPKDLQTKIDIKEKVPARFDNYSGYRTTKFNCLMRNDCLSNYSINIITDKKLEDDERFYQKTTINQSISTSYGSVNIGIPNYNDYKLMEN